MSKKKGIALIFTFLAIIVLTILGGLVISRSISESRIAQRYADSTQAFWLAESGVNRALYELRNNYATTGASLWPTMQGAGRYEVDVENIAIGGRQNKKVTSHGFVPAAGVARAERIIEAIMSNYIPPDFYGNAIYSAGDVDFNGNSYSVTGNVRYADEIDNTGNVTGVITQDPLINPLALLNFQQLLTISQGQGNVYDATRLQDVQRGRDSFPVSFWYSPGVPNVVYVLTDLQLNGDIGSIGGFYVVVGDVLTNPSGTYDATVNGNGRIEGAIYTRGEFKINGGAGRLNVNGGVWAGTEAELNGNATVDYNQEYMDAIKMLDIGSEVQIANWRDTQNPYPVTP